MSEHFDPIDDWLSSDVELLAPRAGAFERVRRRAQRRKAVVAMSTATAVAAVVVAAAVLPHVASALLPGRGGGEANVGQATPTQHASPRPGRQHPTKPSPPPSGKPYLPGSGLSVTGSTTPAAAGFEPTSVTFTTQSQGAALGTTTSGCHARACTTLAGTPDYGQTWTKADAPPAGPPDGASGVSQLRFLDQDHGWAYGPELYYTQDAGATWTQVKHLPGRVIDFGTVGDSAFAVVASCTGEGASFAFGCTSFTLYSSAFDTSDWQPVAGARAQAPVRPGGLQLTHDAGYLLAGSRLFSGSPSGGPWHAVPVASGLVPACLDGHGHRAGSNASEMITPDPSGILYLLCQQVAGGQATLYQSADGGQTWQLASHPAIAGTASSMAVGAAGATLVVATDAGLYYSPDGRTWHRAGLGGQPPADGFSYVGMTNATEGVAVPADPTLKEIFLTSDGGTTWHPKPI